MTPEEFRRYGHQIVDWLADYRSNLEHLPVMAKTQPGEVRRELSATPPDAPESFDEILMISIGCCYRDCLFGSIRGSLGTSLPTPVFRVYLAIS